VGKVNLNALEVNFSINIYFAFGEVITVTVVNLHERKIDFVTYIIYITDAGFNVNRAEHSRAFKVFIFVTST